MLLRKIRACIVQQRLAYIAPNVPESVAGVSGQVAEFQSVACRVKAYSVLAHTRVRFPLLAHDKPMNPETENAAGHPDVRTKGSTDALPLSPSLGLTLDATRMPRRSTLVDRRVLRDKVGKADLIG